MELQFRPESFHWSVLRDMIPAALDCDVGYTSLLEAASAIWNGVSPESGSRIDVGGDSIGIVAPHCTVILDVLRGPEKFASRLSQGKLLSIWHGAMPLLLRHPRTDVCMSPPRPFNALTEVGEQYYGRRMSSGMHSGTIHKGKIIITFEPLTRQPTFGVFCCWYAGNLIAEVQPHLVLQNLLKSDINNFSRDDWEYLAQQPPVPDYDQWPDYQVIGGMDLLELKPFELVGSYHILVEELEDPSWRVFAATCCPHEHTYVHYGEIDAEAEFKLRESVKQHVKLAMPAQNERSHRDSQVPHF